jgi:tyrosyl-tRNA synthetase
MTIPYWIFLGVHYRLGMMLSRESVKTRMEGSSDDGGMSFTEFSYQTFQGYDFLKLK